MKKCIKCNGHKTILSMGGIRLKCEDCKGLGFLVEVKPVEPKVIAEEPTTLVTPLLKANPKKVKVKPIKVEQANV